MAFAMSVATANSAASKSRYERVDQKLLQKPPGDEFYGGPHQIGDITKEKQGCCYEDTVSPCRYCRCRPVRVNSRYCGSRGSWRWRWPRRWLLGRPRWRL